MFGPSKKKIELERLREAEAALTQRVADLEEENRLLTSAVGRHRSDLKEASEKLESSEKEITRLLTELENERAVSAQLRDQLADAADIEKEAALLNARIDRVAKERADYQARIANLEQTIAELRANGAGGPATPTTLDFTELEDDLPSPPPRPHRRPFAEPYRPAPPPSETDRQWLADLPAF